MIYIYRMDLAPSPSPSMAHLTNARAKESFRSLVQPPDSEMLDPDRGATHRGQPQTDENAVSATGKSSGDYRDPRAAQRPRWIPHADVHRGRRRSTHYPNHPHRAPVDVNRCRKDFAVPWDGVGRRDHAPGDTPLTVQEWHRLDP